MAATANALLAAGFFWVAFLAAHFAQPLLPW